MELYFDLMARWNIDSLVGVHRQQLCVRPDWESEIRECLDGGGTTEPREQKLCKLVVDVGRPCERWFRGVQLHAGPKCSWWRERYVSIGLTTAGFYCYIRIS